MLTRRAGGARRSRRAKTYRCKAVRRVMIPNGRYFVMPLLALIAARGADSPVVGSHRLGERRFQ